MTERLRPAFALTPTQELQINPRSTTKDSSTYTYKNLDQAREKASAIYLLSGLGSVVMQLMFDERFKENAGKQPPGSVEKRLAEYMDQGNTLEDAQIVLYLLEGLSSSGPLYYTVTSGTT